MWSRAALAVARGTEEKRGFLLGDSSRRPEKIEFKSCHSAFKAQVSVLQFLVALGFDCKLGLTVVLVIFPLVLVFSPSF